MTIAFDFETFLIQPGLQVPPAVCMSWCHTGSDHAEVVLAAEGIELLTDWLEAGKDFVGANTAFDVLVSVYSAPDPLATVQRWIKAYEEERVTDIFLRQTLIDLSLDQFRHKYSLATVCQACGISAGHKGSPWRTRYSELDGIPVSEWPEDAVEYSREDAIVTARCWEVQKAARAKGSPWFPGRDILLDQYRQAMGALALKDMSSCGIRTDSATVRRFREILERRKAEMHGTLLGHSILRPEYKLDREAVGELLGAPRTLTGRPSLKRALLEKTPIGRLVLAWPESAERLLDLGLATVTYHRAEDAARARVAVAYQGRDLPTTDRGEPSLDNDACEQSGDPVLKGYAEYSSISKCLTTDFQLLDRGTREPIHPHYRPLQQTGRTSSGEGEYGEDKGNAQNLPRRPGVRECYCPRSGNVFFDADFPAIELRTFAQICLWLGLDSTLARDLNSGEDPHLRMGAAIEDEPYVSVKDPGHATQKKRLKSPRVAGKGVNFGRKGMMGEDKFADYAWNNYRVRTAPIGARRIRRDPQSFVKWVERRQWMARRNGEPSPTMPNLEVPDTDLERELVRHGLRLAAFGARWLIELHDMLTPEMPGYSRWVKTMQRPGSSNTFDVLHPWSGRCVAGRGFTDAHNYPFQGLAADLAKRALWRVFKARWTPGDSLFGLPICLFTHDSVTGEAPRERAEAAAYRLAALMSEAAQEVCPGMVTEIQPTLSTRLSKKADDPIYDEAGHLVPWDPWIECQKEYVACGRDRALLVEHGWPEYVIEDVAK